MREYEGEAGMKIAFWSEERNVGTTFNTAVTACGSALMYPLHIAVVSGSYQNKDLEQHFLKRKGENFLSRTHGNSEEIALAADQQEYFHSGGLDALLCGRGQGGLTEQTIKSNMYQVIKDRLYYLPGSTKAEQEWWHEKEALEGFLQVLNALETCFDAVFIDCGNRKDDVAQEMLKVSDICVLNMKQESELIGAYYRNLPKLRGKTFFLVGNYFRENLYTRENLERIYRIEEEMLGAIPYHPQLQAASQNGRTKEAVGKHVEGDIRGKNVFFERELSRTVTLILKRAGVIG